MSDDDESAGPRKVAFWGSIGIAAMMFVGVVIWSAILILGAPETPASKVIIDHFPATFGLPLAAGGAFILVVLLSQTQGPVEFEGLGFKFRGASGPVVLWVLCFLAMVAGIKVLW
tara:strand:- start:124 stop:468 length:345 start_codon:yes stop_codon:yes gene_type:complete